MKKTTEKKIIKLNNNGSSLITALVVMTVVMIMCLSLLLVSSSLHQSTIDDSMENQCRELAESLSNEIQKELESVSYESFDEQTSGLESGENQLWFYLRYNIWQNSWPYYNAGESGHSKEFSDRYFTLQKDKEKFDYLDDISICIYWENIEGNEDKNDTKLDVIVSASKGNKKYEIKSVYTLEVDAYTDEFGNVYDSKLTQKINNPDINPNHNAIKQNEKWNWCLRERE